MMEVSITIIPVNGHSFTTISCTVKPRNQGPMQSSVARPFCSLITIVMHRHEADQNQELQAIFKERFFVTFLAPNQLRCDHRSPHPPTALYKLQTVTYIFSHSRKALWKVVSNIGCQLWKERKVKV